MPNIYIGDAKGMATWALFFAEDVLAAMKAKAAQEERDRELYEALILKPRSQEQAQKPTQTR